MITLQRMRLVNWHYFRDCLIPVGNFCLLSGDNGSGKSTIIDALQFVIASDLRKVRFNAAAGDRRGGRDLAGYIRCKLGSDSTDYLRGDAVGHVMLDFVDGDSRFAAGACVEAWKDGRLSSRFWLAGDLDIAEVAVKAGTPQDTAGGTPLLGRQFQDSLVPRGVAFFDSGTAFRREFTGRLNVWRRMSENNPYIEGFVRSLHFTPLVSVDQFVCDYILEEQTIDLSVMKQNLESYREAEDLALVTRRRLEALSGILSSGEDCLGLERVILQQDWLKFHLERDVAASVLEERREEAQRLEIRAGQIEVQRSSHEARRLALEGERQETANALARNDDHQLYGDLTRRLDALSLQAGEAARQAQRRELLVSQCQALYGSLFAPEVFDGENPQAMADRIQTELEALAASRQTAASQTAAIGESLADAHSELADLKQGIRRLPEAPRALSSALQREGIAAWSLCDLAEVSDPAWSDAVEGWLNTLRFACIVSPDDFSRALAIYDSLPRVVAGVPLPDITRMARDPGTSQVREGSLARLVETENPWARTYLDVVLGDVMCADLETLRRYPKSVTKACMSWSRHTAVRIKEEVYRVAWLGAAARLRRQESLETEIADQEAQVRELQRRISSLEEAQVACRSLLRQLPEVLNLTEAVARRDQLYQDIEQLRSRREAIDTSSFTMLQTRLTELSDLSATQTKAIEGLLTEGGAVATRRQVCADQLQAAQRGLLAAEAAFAAFQNDHLEAKRDCEHYLEERLRTQSPAEILKNFASARSGFETRLASALQTFRSRVTAYASAFSELLAPELGTLPEVRALQARLEGSELPEYLEKIRQARRDAEREFKEHFIARLNELIEEARESFSEINTTLRSLVFGRDEYRFTLAERPERRGQIEVIRRTAAIHEYEDGLFEALVDEADREAANALFQRILTSSLESAELRSLCDYRSYFSYDIRVRDVQATDPATGKNPEYSLARVLKEKSGGEAQTPYYVAIAASFFRFFRDKIDSTIRLVAFDEAFDRLDDERIGKILDFYRNLGLQLILSVPSEKLESIAPYMDTINLVIRRGQLAKVVDFHDRSHRLPERLAGVQV